MHSTPYLALLALQWGHDLAVMERYGTESEYNAISRLQWGHDLAVMERRVRDAGSLKDGVAASMGP